MTYVLALSAAVIWGWTDFMGGKVSRDLRVLAVICVSQLTAALLFLPVVLVTGMTAEAWTHVGWGVLAGVLTPAALGLLYGALAIGPMTIVAPIVATSVAIPVAVGIAQGETLGVIQYGGAAVVMVGIVLATGPSLRSGRISVRAVAMAFGAALSLGLILVFTARGAAGSAVTTVFTMRVVAGILTGGLLMAARGRSGPGVRKALPALVAIGIGDLASSLAFAHATSSGLLSITSVLSSLYPVFTVMFAWWLHSERLRMVQAVGLVAAFAGVALLVG
jgi:drug/metabolite transporter (DMT)-like permease